MPFSLCIIIIFMTFRSVSAFEIQDNVSYIIIIVILSGWVAEYIKIFPWMCIEMYFPRQLSKSLNHSCDNSPLSLSLCRFLFCRTQFSSEWMQFVIIVGNFILLLHHKSVTQLWKYLKSFFFLPVCFFFCRLLHLALVLFPPFSMRRLSCGLQAAFLYLRVHEQWRS